MDSSFLQFSCYVTLLALNQRWWEKESCQMKADEFAEIRLYSGL